jgi:hypothetical protein
MTRSFLSLRPFALYGRSAIGVQSVRVPGSSTVNKATCNRGCFSSYIHNMNPNCKNNRDLQHLHFTTAALSDTMKNSSNALKSSKEGGWVSITSTPHFATLDDVLLGVSQSMECIRSREETPLLIPVDKHEDGTEELISFSTYQEKNNLPCHMAIEARMILSRKKRPTGWFVRFPHVSIANEFVRQSESIPCKIGWKRVFPSHFDPFLDKSTLWQWREPVDILKLDQSSVRVENVPWPCTEEALRSYFRWFEIADDSGGKPPAVVRLIEASRPSRNAERADSVHKADDRKKWNPKFHTFLVRFSDASIARAAVRERHLGEMMGQKVYLNQYPRQLIEN